MGFLPDSLIAAFQGAYNLGVFFRLGTTPTLNYWFGVSDVQAAIPDVDAAGTIYRGGGMLLDVPDAIEMLINGTADTVQFGLDGVNPALAAELLPSAPPVVGARASIALTPLDSRWQLLSAPWEAWVGHADYWAQEMPAQSDVTKPRTLSLMLSCASGDAARGIPDLTTWTDQQQRQLSATDAFCERVQIYYQGRQVSWPKFS